jgi:Mce-associated membrane protein
MSSRTTEKEDTMSKDIGTEPKRAVDAEAESSVAAPAEKTAAETTAQTAKMPRTLSIRLSSVATVAAGVALIASAAVFGSLWLWARGDLRDRDDRAAAQQHAEQVATDYAVGASNIDYRNVGAWIGKLKAGTSPQLAGKFDATAPKLQEILVPLKWTSSATPIAAKVMSNENGVYKVDVFLDVNSTSAQTPQGAQTTVTYTVDVDPGSGWKVTDVGGMAGALPKQ